MAYFNNGNNCYFEGKQYLKKGDYIGARHQFQICYQESETYRESALTELISIDLIEAKYKDAREKALLIKDQESPMINLLLGKLEKNEYNYNRAIAHYLKAANYSDTQAKALIGLALTYIQLGENGIAKPILETTKQIDKYRVISILNQSTIALLTGNYKKACDFLNEVKENDVAISGLKKEYCNQVKLVSYYTKEIRSELNLNPSNDYFVYSLFDDSFFISHIERHLKRDSLKDGGVFFKGMDLKKLYKEAKGLTEIINPNVAGATCNYTIPSDSQVGIIAGKATNAVCLTVHLNGKPVTMYPIQLSSECDQEGYSCNKKVLVKRSQGGY